MTGEEVDALIGRLVDMGHDDARAAATLIEQQRAMLTKFATIVQHATADRSGVYFICGGTEAKEDGLPMKIMVCPAYGLDGFAWYTKSSEYSAPGY